MRIAAGTVVAVLSFVAPLWAQDFQVGARAKGMGGSYTAFEDDPVSVWLNPAGIARQGWKAAIHYQTFTQYELQREEDSFGGSIGKAEPGLTEPPAIPAFAGVIMPVGSGKSKDSFAFCLVRPFENRLTYEFPAPPADYAQTDQQFWRFRLAYAHGFILSEEGSFFPRISFGMAGDIAYTRYVFKSYDTSGVVFDDLNDTNTKPGYGAGMLATLYDDQDSFRLDIGAAYQSKVDFELQMDEGIFAPWDWPQMLNAGATLYLFGQALRLTFDVQWIDWDGATEDSSDPQYPSIESTVNFSAGVEYQFAVSEEVWLLPRAGYRLYDAPWSDENNLPAIDLTRLSIDTEAEKFNIVTVGLGVRWKGEEGKFRGIDVGVEFGGDVTNYSVGYTQSF
jgi:hypothetical protein